MEEFYIWVSWWFWAHSFNWFLFNRQRHLRAKQVLRVTIKLTFLAYRLSSNLQLNASSCKWNALIMEWDNTSCCCARRFLRWETETDFANSAHKTNKCIMGFFSSFSPKRLEFYAFVMSESSDWSTKCTTTHTNPKLMLWNTQWRFNGKFPCSQIHLPVPICKFFFIFLISSPEQQSQFKSRNW